MMRTHELEKERCAQLEKMAIIIDKNEELEKEIMILTRALELKNNIEE